MYGGTLDVVSGELVVDRAMVDLGSLSWSYRSANNFFYASVSGKKTYQSATDYPILKTSIYPFGGNIGMGAETTLDGTIWNRSAQGSTDIIIKDTAYSDVTAFTSAVSGQTLVYELATPQTYQLTPTEVDLLLGQNNLWTDCGSVEVTYKADVGLYIDKKLSSNGTRSLSMGLTKLATVESETETEPSKTEAEETKAEETKTEEVKTEPSKTETDKTETETR